MSNKRPVTFLSIILLGALTLVGCTNEQFLPTTKRNTDDSEITTKDYTTRARPTRTSPSGRTTKKGDISNEINFYSWSDEFQGILNYYYGGHTVDTDEHGNTFLNEYGQPIEIGKKVSSYDGSQTILNDGTIINWHIYNDLTTIDYMDALDEALVNGTCDMYYVEESIVAKYIDSNYTTDMALLGLDQSHQFQYTKDAVTNPYTNKVVGTMFYANPGTIMYNYEMAKEIFGDDITTSDMDNMLSTDYDTFIETCNEVARNGYSVIPCPQDTFLQYACNTTTNMLNTLNKTVTIDKNFFKWALDSKYMMDKHYFYTTASQWVSEWAEAIGNDNCFLSLSCNWFADWTFRDYYCRWHHMDGYSSSFDSGWRITKGVIPWYWGGTWTIVNPVVLRNINKKNTISDILIDLTTDKERAKEISREKTLHSYSFTNHIEAMEELEIENPWTDNFYGRQNLYTIYNEAIEGINIVNKGMYDQFISQYIYAAFTSYVNGSLKANEAFNMLKNEVIRQTYITDVLLPNGVTLGDDIIIT